MLAEQLSKFERQQRIMAEQIAQIEDENVAAKPWQMTGGKAALMADVDHRNP